MRVKRGVATHQKHRKIRQATKGFSHSNRVSYRRGKQAVTRSLQFATRDRKTRKRTFRQLWNARINAAAHLNNTTYSQLIANLKQANVILDRKILADLAVNEPSTFSDIVKFVQKNK